MFTRFFIHIITRSPLLLRQKRDVLKLNCKIRQLLATRQSRMRTELATWFSINLLRLCSVCNKFETFRQHTQSLPLS